MADYVVGDVQGCADALDRLLAAIAFSPSRDRLFVLGDLVNRGPSSLAVLRTLHGFGAAAQCLLGNHDLHLLAAAQGVRGLHRDDSFDDVLASPERDAWLDWLRRQRLAIEHDGWLMVHAGVVPQWDARQALALAGEVEAQLAGPRQHELMRSMYGNEPARWRDDLQGPERWRVVINALTRLRFCLPDGTMDFKSKDSPHEGKSQEALIPWFDVPGRRTQGVPIACGHWSTLGYVDRPDLLAIDTGCVWGGLLTAVRIDEGRREKVQVSCGQAQRPGR